MSSLSFHISVRPFHLKHQGICGIRIQNHCSLPTTFTISGQAVDKQIQFEAMPGNVTIPLGQKGGICVRVKRKRPFLGLKRKINFTIQVQASDGHQQTLPGHLEVAPLLPIWSLALVTLVTAVCLLLI
ncbi:MAG: hypothetical protein H6656_00160 [Ardenticatenaceae bacterium]|nr:hypothetical protein [Ardenticatenaceae bacterium]